MENEIAVVFVVAGVILEKDNKYLLVQEKQPKAYGLWNLPAGKVDLGESLEEAAVREAKEETGFDVEIVGRVGVFHEEISRPIKHVFEARIVGGALNIPEDELLDAKWFSFDEISQMKSEIRGKWILESLLLLHNK